MGEIESMTNSTRLFGLIMTVALCTGVARAQAPRASEMGDDAPPALTLPLPSMEGAATTPATPHSLLRDTPSSAHSADSATPPLADPYDLSVGKAYPDLAGLWSHTAPIESTGTWLQRGIWYAEADAVILNRLWNRDNRIYAAQDPDVERIDFFQSTFTVAALLDTNRLLVLNASQPGEDAAVRMTLGHFLFRDSRNRDHTAEFTALGGGNWEQERVITSEEPFGLFVPFVVDGGNLSFDASSRQTLNYESHIKSFEMNYRVSQRLGHDQLIMDPNGGWHRAANAGFEREYLAGLRFIELEDKFEWQAEDIATLGDDGEYLIRTDNDMFGVQIGGGMTYQASRWSAGVFGRGGVYLNDALGRTDLDFTADDDNDAVNRLRDNELSVNLEMKLQTRFHITPNVSLRAAYELMYFESVALAPSQATFIPVFSYLNTTGDPFYHGTSFGIEGYW
jgi:hypothetical protein